MISLGANSQMFVRDTCLLTFRPTHPASINGLSWHMWVKRSRILPVTLVFFACSTIFQCCPISTNWLSTYPRLRSPCSPISGIIPGSACFLFSHPFPSFSWCWLHAPSHDDGHILPAGFVLRNANSNVDTIAAAVTFVRCAETSDRPSFRRKHSWIPVQATPSKVYNIEGIEGK